MVCEKRVKLQQKVAPLLIIGRPSGAADGDNCIVEQLYSWCSNGTIVKRKDITLPWFDANTPKPNDRCLLVKLNDSKFAQPQNM
jgi:hypothetical protein